MSTFLDFTYRSVKTAARRYFEPLRWVGRLFQSTGQAQQATEDTKGSVLILSGSSGLGKTHSLWNVVQDAMEAETDKNQESKPSIRQALQQLSPEERRLIYLRYWEGYSIKDIAGEFGVSNSAIYKRLKALKKRLRDTLEVLDLD